MFMIKKRVHITEAELNRGRIEQRKLEVISATHCGIKWPGLMQAGRITRTRIIKNTGKTTTETVHFITSLPESHTTPKQLLTLNRNHWRIENSLHWVKDNLFAEDRSTIRTKTAPQAAAALRNLAPHLIKKAGLTPTIARENFALNIANAIETVAYRIT